MGSPINMEAPPTSPSARRQKQSVRHSYLIKMTSFLAPTEAMNMASMEQYHTLWTEELRGGLPILFHVSDNSYAVGDQPAGETMGHQMLARIGAAVNPQQMHAERINGYDVLAAGSIANWVSGWNNSARCRRAAGASEARKGRHGVP